MQEKTQEKAKTNREKNYESEQKQTQKETQLEEEADEEGDDQLPDIEPSTKRRKVTLALTEEQEEGLVDWFKDNEIFYNRSLREFKNKDKKERMMSEKANELNISFAGWLN